MHDAVVTTNSGLIQQPFHGTFSPNHITFIDIHRHTVIYVTNLNSQKGLEMLKGATFITWNNPESVLVGKHEKMDEGHPLKSAKFHSTALLAQHQSH